MKFVVSLALLASVCVTTAWCAVPYPIEHYGYVNVDPSTDSNFFYALRADDNSTLADRQSMPLVMFLQGGPGGSSFLSDYMETGPIKVTRNDPTNPDPSNYKLSPRFNHWSRHGTVLYVDNPIGTGFSYTNITQGYSTTDTGIADNLVLFMKGFLIKHPEYAGNDFWVFCESYGGKMTAYFGAALADSIKTGSISNLKFKGVSLGDGWLDPVGCMESYGPYLESLSQINPTQRKVIESYAVAAQSALNKSQGNDATNAWSAQQQYIGTVTNNLNWYNSLYYYDYTPEDQVNYFLTNVFPNQVAKGVIPPGVVFGQNAGTVFSMMSNDFMHTGYAQVDALLSQGYTVGVYTGQLDLIVDNDCANGWLKKLTWPSMAEFWGAPRNFVMSGYDRSNVGAFYQVHKNLQVWEIMKAGHMAPFDNGYAAEVMLASIIGSKVPVPVPANSPSFNAAEETPKYVGKKKSTYLP